MPTFAMTNPTPTLISQSEMDRLFDGLARVMEPTQVGCWLKAPNPAFDGSTPLQVVERGEPDRIWRMLFDVESGQPG